MRIIPPSAVLNTITPDAEQLIERCGRVSHRSEDKITKNSHSAFAKKMVELGHLSVLEHASATFFITCSRGISHELVRHRLASYTQESTRYVTYNELDIVAYHPNPEMMSILQTVGEYLEGVYKEALKHTTPQYARDVLPTCAATRLYMTANFRQWREIIEKRCDKAAHPQIRYIFKQILHTLNKCYPSCFEDLLVRVD